MRLRIPNVRGVRYNETLNERKQMTNATLEVGQTYTTTTSGITGIIKAVDNHPSGVARILLDVNGTEIVGYNFIINVEKSRYVREKSKIPVTVSFDGGINKWSGLLDVALEGNFVTKPSNGWYAKVDQETGEVLDKKRFADTQTEEFWKDILANESFKEYVRKKYEITYSSILGEDAVLEEEDEAAT